MIYQQLVENKEYNMARKAFKSLSFEASSAITSWEYSNWDSGKLSHHFEQQDNVAQEIISVFAPIRDMMKKQYGDTITLYRGVIPEPNRPIRADRILFSWSINPDIADIFAGKRPARQKFEIVSDAEITNAVAQYERTGFVSFHGIKYIRNKEYPEYYNMYNHHNQYITDGDNLERDFNRTRDDRIQSNHNTDEVPGKIFKKQIPIDDIVWILNSQGSQEYIVNGHIE